MKPLKIIAGIILIVAGPLLILMRRPILESLVGKTKIKLGLLLGVDRVHTALVAISIIGIGLIVIGSLLIFFGMKNSDFQD